MDIKINFVTKGKGEPLIFLHGNGEDHMYFAAMKSKSCALTSIGKQYWRLVHNKLI